MGDGGSQGHQPFSGADRMALILYLSLHPDPYHGLIVGKTHTP